MKCVEGGNSDIAQLKEFIRERKTPTVSSLSSETVPPKSLCINLHEDTEKGSKSTRFSGAFSLSSQPQVNDKSNLKTKSQKLHKVITPTTHKVRGTKTEPSNILKSASQLNAKSDLEVGKGLAQPAFEDGNLQSVLDKTISKFFNILTT